MELIGIEDEPYCTMSPAAASTGRRTRTTPDTSNFPEVFHIPLTRDHFIPNILTFDDW